MEETPLVNILLVDDQPGNLVALEAILAGLGQKLVPRLFRYGSSEAFIGRRFRPDPA